MINNNSNALTLIREITNKIMPGCRILLFGSRARRDYSIDSDYDLLIITKGTVDIRRKRILKSRLRKELALVKIPVDVLI